jgi:glycerophosphoryl diester phosphodiesterase
LHPLFRACRRPLIVAHRGACGVLPEQTIAAFSLAIEQGTDAIELDVVPTRDGVLISRHESELSLTTDVAWRPQFAARRTTQVIEGAFWTGWFTTDFTFDDIQTLRSRERMPFRDHSADGKFPVPSLAHVLNLADVAGVMVFLEVKHPAHFISLGFAIDDLVLDAVSGRERVIIQSFESDFLRRMRTRTNLPIIQLFDRPDFNLHDIARHADGIGPSKRLIVPAPADEDAVAHTHPPKLLLPTSLLSEAHALGLFVSTWTFRDEPQFLAADYQGDPAREYRHFASLGVDAITTDFPATAVSTCRS